MKKITKKDHHCYNWKHNFRRYWAWKISSFCLSMVSKRFLSLFRSCISTYLALCLSSTCLAGSGKTSTPASERIGILNTTAELSEQWIVNNALPAFYLQTPAQLEHTDIILINAAIAITEAEKRLAIQAYYQGKILMFDGLDTTDAKQMSGRIASIVGLGLTDPFVIARRDQNGTPSFKTLSTDSTLTRAEAINILTRSTNDAISPWIKPSAFGLLNIRAYDSDNHNSSAYRPESTVSLEFRRVGFPCRVGDDFQGNGFTNNADWEGVIEDACHGQASASIFYTLDFIRSVPFQGGGSHNTENAKYVRITLDPATSGGAGWHLVDKPTHKHSWFQSWSNRISWYGPIAMDYGVRVYSTDPRVRLFHNTPNNTGLEQDIREVSGISIGVDAGGKVDIGDKGPSIGADVKGSFSYTSSRWVSYKTHEYEIANLSSLDTAQWMWDRNFKERAKNWRTHSVAPIWSSSWFFDDNAFSPAAYANYKPGFSAIYKVEGDQNGYSDFYIDNRITIAALSGRVQYAGLASTYEPFAYSGSQYSFLKSFKVNWDAPVFQPEINVSLEAFALDSAKGLCISAPTTAGQNLSADDCLYTNNQLWGLDKEQRYHSRSDNDLCLTLSQNTFLSTQTCSASASQKWRWVDNQLVSELGPKLIITQDKQIAAAPIGSEHYDQWRSYVRHLNPDQVITIYP
jgi:hemolysin